MLPGLDANPLRRELRSQVRRAFGTGLPGRNKLHNGSFRINQRAVSGSVTLAAGAFGHDRWKAGAAGCTYTFAAVGSDTVITITAGTLLQVVEGVNVDTDRYVLTNMGTAPARVSVNGAATSGGYANAAPLATPAATGGSTMSVEFSLGTLDRVQLEAGTVPTSFERRPYSFELALCQRYLPAFNSNGTADDVGWGGTTTTAGGIVGYSFLVEPRVPPTGIVVSNVAHFAFTTMVTNSAATAISFVSAGKRSCRLSVTGTATPYLASQPAILLASSASGQILFTGAEL